MDGDESYSDTIDVTIEIDDEVAQGINALEVKSRKQGPWIRPPLRLEDVRVRCANSLSIANLSNEAVALLISHLSLPSYGSLKNWDSIGIYLGISDVEIMSFRQDARPMEAVLKKCQHMQVKDLIKALQRCKRIDMLYSLKRLEQRGKLEKPLEQFVGINSVSTSLASPIAVSKTADADPVKTILLVHYEEDDRETKDFRWLRKNLIQHASQRGYRISDIADLDIDINLTSTVEEAFAKAHQIVVSFTPSHIEAVKTRSSACRSVLYMHDLMSQEFFTLNSANKRFRPVIFNDTQPSDLPVGWPRSTLVYHFPTNMAALCTKIFKSNDQDNNSRMITS
nr:Protein C15B12.6 [Haemonchus contortus]